MTHRVRFVVLSVLPVLALALAMPVFAQQIPPAAPVAARQAPPAAPVHSVAVTADAEQVRDEFFALLQKYPPSLGYVLRLDPSLMTNESYLAPYPGVVGYLAGHPEIQRNPEFFLQRYDIDNGSRFSMSEDAQRRRAMAEILAGVAAFLVFLTVTGVLVWLVRLVIDTRRWNRVSRTQAEVHTKLLERFSSNEDLLAYIQTPVGRRFLESGPSPMQLESRPLGAPSSRILWSVQAGVVLSVASGGLWYLSMRLPGDAAQFFLVLGVGALALGAGFLVSSAAAYGLSRRLGLLKGSDSEHA